MSQQDVETFYPVSSADWRKWLKKNHESKQSVWVIQYKKMANIPTISWSESVDEALCFGWVDSIRKSIDDEKFMQFFCKRKAKSTWSKINKEKIKVLIAQKLMAEAGYKSIEIAKQNGSWTILDEVEELKIPLDLELAFKTKAGSADYFALLSKSVRKAILQWLMFAKRVETREKRINEIAELAAQGLKPKQFR